MEVNYDRDIHPFRKDEDEGEHFDCFLCHEPVSEFEAIMVQTDIGIFEAAHPIPCFKELDPWAFWMARL